MVAAAAGLLGLNIRQSFQLDKLLHCALVRACFGAEAHVSSASSDSCRGANMFRKCA